MSFTHILPRSCEIVMFKKIVINLETQNMYDIPEKVTQIATLAALIYVSNQHNSMYWRVSLFSYIDWRLAICLS